ncbi:MAG TPA: hypothetical protein VFZ61_23155 [Polyangiales bacterium]
MPSDPERMIGEAVDLVRRLASDNHPLARRRRLRRKQRIKRILRSVIVAAIATFVLIPTLIAAGFLLGPHGVEGLIATPILLVAIWSAALAWGFRTPRTKPETLKRSALALLPAQTGDFIEQERKLLPSGAQSQLDAIVLRLDALAPQLASLKDEAEGASEVRRLLGDELPELVRGYRKVPGNLTQQPLYGGSTPERQLIDGLGTIDAQLKRLHERLAQDDLHAFATHQRYLELKYKGDEDSRS